MRVLLLDWLRDHPAAFSMVTAFTDVPMGRWLTWAHIGTTVSIAIFVWTQYQAFAADQIALRIAISENKAAIEALRVLEDQRHAAEERRDADIDMRLAVHRDDIRALQTQLSAHFDRPK